MTDKELRHLSRMELIRLLLEQTRELDRMQLELEQARAALEDRSIRIQNAGSIAEAALQLSRVMEAAQDAADQYIINLKREYKSQAMAHFQQLKAQMLEMEEATKAKCAAMLQEAQRKAENYGE